MEEHGGHTYRSFVRGVPIDFSPENIRNVMRFRAQVQGATTDFKTRKEHDQQLEDEDKPMPQAEDGNEEGNEEGFYNQAREEQREMAKEIQQLKNYQVNQTMVDSARNKAIFDELAAVRSRQEEFFSNHANQYNMIRQEQKLLGKEILDVKKYQMSAVTMGSGSSSSPTPQRYEPDQALMKIREQHANFSEMQRQLKDWTRNASARECYTVWAHQ
ncbi:hypothetical protein PIB30_076689 [Stylosanthes scabra]|uniref:Uncharacterized protein n=2 Tax=Stylosanthes scabra TaxID=79078 RepID=A0ABU6UT17_9FABA|nr:hypothetical protein [Stylosanthes scabra]